MNTCSVSYVIDLSICKRVFNRVLSVWSVESKEPKMTHISIRSQNIHTKHNMYVTRWLSVELAVHNEFDIIPEVDGVSVSRVRFLHIIYPQRYMHGDAGSLMLQFVRCF